jgi:pyruvate kinase
MPRLLHPARRLSKIVCTIGRASESEEMLSQLIDAGMDIARLNFSHGDHLWHRTVCERIRRLSDQVGIMGDVQGPKLRIGRMKDDHTVILKRGDRFVLTSRPVIGSSEMVSVDYLPLPQEVAVGDTLYLNDGLISLCVHDIVDGTDIVCKVQNGGPLSSRKGINAPLVKLALQVPTEKDRRDIKLAADIGMDFLAVSFVSSADDLACVREIARAYGADMPLISKIERHIALDHFETILEASDGVMVARGDLAVEIPTEEVPRHQKHIIARCNQIGKPVICATQMLESMCVSPVPTRAEVSDVFNAVLDGADAVMLSAESATGAYPVETVEMMSKIALNAEQTMPWRDYDWSVRDEVAYSESIGHGISTMVEHFARRGERVAAILAITRTGYSARMIAKYRPGIPIIAVTNNIRVARQLNLTHGIMPVIAQVDLSDPSSMTQTAALQALKEHHLKEDDVILTVAAAGWAPQSHINFVGLFTVRDLLLSS